MKPKQRVLIPVRSTHVHDLCGHGCDCYNPADAVCRDCRARAFNQRQRGDPEDGRNPEGL